jgi:dTDP-4-amino-4,6-dideoxygalactose transaminase
MTEFAAVMGIVGLKYLDLQNEIRRANHILLRNKLSSNTIEVRSGPEDSKSVYYSNLIVIKNKLDKEKNNKKIIEINKQGIPIKRTWQPLHKHKHFDVAKIPARGIPWIKPFTDKKYKDPNEIKLKVCEEYCENYLYELDCHPLIEQKIIIKASEIILKEFDNDNY